VTDRVHILGVEVDRLTHNQVLDEVFRMIASGERGYLCTMNAAMLVESRKNEDLARAVNRARFVVADGQSLVWGSRLLGDALPQRVAGVDLIDPLAARAAHEGLGVYLLGATEEVCERMVERLTREHPGLRICGHAHGYFEKEEEQARADEVAASGAQILFVAMGVPRQESFLESHWEALGVPFAMTVGGSFDVLSGRLRRAPVLIQKVGLEWAFRLAQEPGRLWRRYLVTNTKFICLVCRQMVRRPWKDGR
jgi:N-acetylglucosaminyldiphosphoundecaprenol N-acetyl-beta-D-mannosaminyltransferase